MSIASTVRRPLDDVVAEIDHVSRREHFVHFYDHDQQLCDGVARFLAVGFAQSHLAIVIAKQSRISAIAMRLADMGLDADMLRASGLYSVYEAEELLARFMVNGRPDPRRFRAIIGTWMKAAASTATSVRAFGEMVSILWENGNRQAAIELEQIWNELSLSHDFTLYCAYPISISEEPSGDSFVNICHEHSRIISSLPSHY